MDPRQLEVQAAQEFARALRKIVLAAFLAAILLVMPVVDQVRGPAGALELAKRELVE
jgi:hypothetical protein